VAQFGQVLTAVITPFTEDGDVDYETFSRLCHHLVANGSDGIVVSGTTGEAPTLSDEEKLALTAAALRIRRAHPGAFAGAQAGYRPLPTSTGHAVAFARTEDGQARSVTIATRLSASLHPHGGWNENTVVLPEGQWRNVLAGADAEPIEGGPQELADLLKVRPVALLEALDVAAGQ